MSIEGLRDMEFELLWVEDAYFSDDDDRDEPDDDMPNKPVGGLFAKKELMLY